MKKLTMSLLLMIFTTSIYAQEWKMVITKTDGTQMELLTNEIVDVQFLKPQMEEMNVDQIIIKEVYNGGCMKDDGTSKFQYDKYIILYNNCPQKAVINNLCFGMGSPASASANNKNYDADGNLTYESEGFIPVWNGIWWFPQSLVIEPYSQVVVNVCGAIDNTQTVSQSVNFAHSDYYCMYDPESGYFNTNYYPTPSDVIPTSHYLKAILYAQANAWPLSVTSPAIVLFQTRDVYPQEFATNADNYWYDEQKVDKINRCVKVPNEWIIDGMEVFATSYREKCTKRLTADIDAGYVWLTNYQGHSLYRNVDQEMTESLPENKGKLVYGYDKGVDDSTDPSSIDAEASIKNGAHIVYQDTDNSSADFHERIKCSLRD
ncbi:MAG: DUF4876 domain-containing protein [Prevotella sp.]|nr:DUF4876 domain-containing protein [Prevotella sp.]